MADEEILGLEAKLRQLAAKGELSHFSIVPVAGKGNGGVVFSASYSPASRWGSGFGRDADPVKAAMASFKNVQLPKTHAEAMAEEPAAPRQRRKRRTATAQTKNYDDSDFV